MATLPGTLRPRPGQPYWERGGLDPGNIAVTLWRAARPTQVAKIMNREVIAQARNYVWAIDTAELGQVEQFMSTLPDRVLLSEEQKERALAAARGEPA